MSESQHQELAAGKWHVMPISAQLGNAGAEVGRAFSWRARNNAVQAERAFVRALELLDLTLSDTRWSDVRRREIARVREAVCTTFHDSDDAAREGALWDRYFIPFAVMARSSQ